MSSAHPTPATLDWRKFETARLVMRPFTDDAATRAFCLQALSNPDIVKQMGSIPQPYGDADFDAFVAKLDQKPDHFEWSIRMRDDPAAVIGQICLREADENSQRTIAYFSLPETWGKGIVTEALNAVVEFAFDVLEVKTLLSEVYNDNPGSLGVMRKAGFSPSGQGDSTSTGRSDCTRYPHTEFVMDAKSFRSHRMRDGCHTYTAIVSRQLPIITVAAAAIVNMEGQILVAQRPPGKSMAGLWEFPGGKLESGETPEAALIRELHEELGIDTDHSCLSPVAFASHSYAKFHLMMPVFAIRQWRGDIQGREGQAFKWVKPVELWKLPMPAADEPLIPLLIDLL